MPFKNARRITSVGHDVWVGFGAFVKAGVKIGTGAVVAAHSVVVSDVPPYAIVAGVPARVKRFRFPESTIARLLASRWWDYGIYEFLGEPITNPENFCDLLEEKQQKQEIFPYQPKTIDAESFRKLVGNTD
ncbi:hypothetical protein APZ41_016795 [Roseomonas mucosa]|uniref:Chloramphenicol acetyltransferase n=1 Tax=Roseomonas mucosa TaxID=207340 RepID=A0A1S8D205_9PROT|nr:hypothetical protein APZ41_016795 [Roseomonas mucosa]